MLTVPVRDRAVSVEVVRGIDFLCPEAMAGAAEILDHKPVHRCIARESRREFVTIEATPKTAHCVLPGFCTCSAYCFQVAAKSDAHLCKHELAVMIASALSLGVTNELDEERWAAEFGLATGLALLAHT